MRPLTSRPSELVRADAVEQVDQRRERELGLGAAPPRREHPHPTLASEIDGGLPQLRLPDPRPTGENERGEPVEARNSSSAASSGSRPTS
jgi:hypothetical protein